MPERPGTNDSGAQTICLSEETFDAEMDRAIDWLVPLRGAKPWLSPFRAAVRVTV